MQNEQSLIQHFTRPARESRGAIIEISELFNQQTAFKSQPPSRRAIARSSANPGRRYRHPSPVLPAKLPICVASGFLLQLVTNSIPYMMDSPSSLIGQPRAKLHQRPVGYHFVPFSAMCIPPTQTVNVGSGGTGQNSQGTRPGGAPEVRHPQIRAISCRVHQGTPLNHPTRSSWEIHDLRHVLTSVTKLLPPHQDLARFSDPNRCWPFNTSRVQSEVLLFCI